MGVMSPHRLHAKQLLHLAFFLVAQVLRVCGALLRAGQIANEHSDDALGATGRALAQFPGTWAGPRRKMLKPRLSSPYSKEWPNTIAICALMKDERVPDVKEFLEYHRWIGVDSFFIRENGDSVTDEMRDLLEPYERMGVLNFALAPGPKYPLQTDWYNECARLASVRHNWIAFIDIDEFMVVLNKERADTRQGGLKKLMNHFFRYNAVVSMQWLLFGSNGYKYPPEAGQLEGFQRCTGVPSRQMKCFASAYWFHQSGVFQVDQVHQSVFRIGGIGVFGDGEPLPMSHALTLPNNATQMLKTAITYPAHLRSRHANSHTAITPAFRLVLNHYVTRAQDEFIERKIRLGGTGKFAEAFAEILRGLHDKDDIDAAYKQFEADFGFDGDHAICRQGAAVGKEMQSAIDRGTWSAVPHEPGLLAGGMARLLQE